MKTSMFLFEPSRYREEFTTKGYVHIRKGVSDEFYRKMSEQVDLSITDYVVMDKQQAVYNFPDDGDYLSDLCEAVGEVTGTEPSRLVLSERHIKAYEQHAERNPPAHKDRFASQVSVGIGVHVPEGSTLVLYPYEQREANPFNSAVRLRPRVDVKPLFYSSPAALRGGASGPAPSKGGGLVQPGQIGHERNPGMPPLQGRRVEIADAPGDVVMFCGHTTWHLRANSAKTTMLYLKLNDFNCDPLGEDPRTPEVRQRTLDMLRLGDTGLPAKVPMIGRRVDYFHRYLTRDWVEVPSAVFWGERHFMLDDEELKIVQAIDGHRTLGAVCETAGLQPRNPQLIAKIRQLAEHGVIDLVSSSQCGVES